MVFTSLDWVSCCIPLGLFPYLPLRLGGVDGGSILVADAYSL